MRRILIGAVVARAVACATACAVAAGGCACESRIGINGDEDTDTSEGSVSWDPPIENLGETGWRESTEPLCPGFGQFMYGYDVWSDPRGVFLLGSDEVTTVSTDTMQHLFLNDGTGWRMLYEEDLTMTNFAIRNIMGFPGGTIFGWGGCGDMYNLWEISDGTATRENEFSVCDVFVVRAGLAYACTTVGLLRNDGTAWTRVAAGLDCPTPGHLWADETSVFVAYEDGLVYELAGTEWIVHETGTFTSLTAIWGFGADDVWVSAVFEPSRLFHFDGTGWTEVDWTSADPAGGGTIEGMWGVDGTLFLHTSTELLEWDGASVRSLGRWPTGEYSAIVISAVWGNSPTEVFLAVRDEANPRTGCGTEYMLWWDGAEFHWF